MSVSEWLAQNFASVISLILGTSALINISQFLRRKTEERKIKAEAIGTEIGTTKEVIVMLREEMERKDKEIEKLRIERADALTQIDKLNTLLIETRIDRDSYKIQLSRILDIRDPPASNS